MPEGSKWKLCLILVAVCLLAANRDARAQTVVYYSVGTSVADLKSGSLLGAQEAYLESGAFPELLSIYHLFGDPALPLR